MRKTAHGMMAGFILGSLTALVAVPVSETPHIVPISFGIILGAMGLGAILGSLFKRRR